jgi:hypothetical protein
MPPEPLDYQTPGENSRFDMAIVCPACGQDGAVRGTLVSGELWYFLPSGMKRSYLGIEAPRTMAFSYACVKCGVVTTVVDPDDLRKLLGVQEKKTDDAE